MSRSIRGCGRRSDECFRPASGRFFFVYLERFLTGTVTNVSYLYHPDFLREAFSKVDEAVMNEDFEAVL